MYISDELRSKLSVDTARFILFLYIQNIPRLSLKSSLLTGEEYPIPPKYDSRLPHASWLGDDDNKYVRMLSLSSTILYRRKSSKETLLQILMAMHATTRKF